VQRKLRRYDAAVALYEQAIGLNAHNPASQSGLGYTLQLMGRTHQAMEVYHRALGLRPDDAFAAEMLDAVVREECVKYGQELLQPDGLPELVPAQW
jgi:anaphase-promoting complex subunit 6